jgi:competence protein ComEC
MPKHVVLFLLCLSFIAGVVSASLGLSVFASLIPAALAGTVLIGRRTPLILAAASALLFIGGAYYYHFDDSAYRASIATIPPSGELEGSVADDPKQSESFESFSLKTRYGAVFIETDPSALFHYGDTVRASGRIDPPTENYYGRHIVAIMRDPTLTRVAPGGNALRAFLFGIKHRIEDSFAALFPADKAALLSGIVFGDNRGLTKEFSDALALSGTRFITAIDGLHLQIVILIFFTALSSFVSKRIAASCTAFLVFFFVAMTGFTVSGMRAAFMAALAASAKGMKRTYVPSTVIAVAALVLILFNPKAPLFDAGFQLSFTAVISIIYFMPVLRRFLRFSEDPGFLGIKESFLITLSVQLATAPIVISVFSSFSLTGFAGSIAVVLALPYVLALGFLVGLFALILPPLALLLALLLSPALSFITGVVEFFSAHAVPFNPSLDFPVIAAYYSVLVFLAYRFYEKRPDTAAV